MKTRTIISLCVIGLGILIWIGYLFFGGEFGGLGVLFLGVPLIITGVFLLFSYIGSILVFLGMFVHLFVTQRFRVIGGTQPAIIYLGAIIILIGIVYGIVEGIVKLVKHHKK